MKKAIEELLNTSTGKGLSSDIEMAPDEQISYENIDTTPDNQITFENIASEEFSDTFESDDDFVFSSDDELEARIINLPDSEENNVSMLSDLAHWVSKHSLSRDATNELFSYYQNMAYKFLKMPALY